MTSGIFIVLFVLLSIPLVGLQFARDDQPDPLPLTLTLIPIWAGTFLASLITTF